MAGTNARHRAERTRLICEYYRIRRVAPSVWVHNRTTAWWDSVVSTFTEAQWIKNFRMSKDTFMYLCRRLQPQLERQDTNYRLCITIEKRIAIALWKLATNSEYRSISHLFGIGVATVCRCVHDFCSAVEKVLMPEVIKLPNSEKLKEMATYFERRWGLPQCVGAIDGSHIPILGPEDYHTEYFNRKGWHSIILQAVVDGRGLFWNVFVGAPGSLHDARVLRLSGLWGLFDRGLLLPDVTKNICGHDVGYFVLGDAAYLLKSWLMKPFTDNGQLTPQKIVYNQKTSRARVVVENAFGRLKGRWRCLLKRNDCSTHKVKSLVIACCVLHNLCEMNGDEFREEWVTGALNQPDGAQSATVEAEGLDARTALMQFLTTT
ncbi:uncharacterized protein LOC127953028 [Carassius gibelio]|uniref:uncharacterized protein LOC127953028 n=1 Tax=Carassius gibelio TaxID=101364 RepID=UPI002278CFA5|nr:uncharacterized protein LOC127953028 [Carassius gibelio]